MRANCPQINGQGGALGNVATRERCDNGFEPLQYCWDWAVQEVVVLMVRLGRVGWIADVWRALNNGCKSKRFWPLQAQSHDTSIPAVLNMYLIPTYISTSLSTIKSLARTAVLVLDDYVLVLITPRMTRTILT